MNLEEFIDSEISFHQEINNPWYWKLISRLFGRQLCNEAVVSELVTIKMEFDINHN